MGVDAKVGLGTVISGKVDIILSRWSVGWDEPGDGVGEERVVGLVNLDVLVVEDGSVPENVDVDLVELHWGVDLSSKVEGKVLSLDDWVW